LKYFKSCCLVERLVAAITLDLIMSGRGIRLLLAGLTVLAVAVVFLAPTVDLEPSALRAAQAARVLQTAMLSAAFALGVLLCFASLCLPQSRHDGTAASLSDLLRLNCTLLC
jgi:ABC-type uncharacterized transport system permease subunit